jgi:hypothetical protein
VIVPCMNIPGNPLLTATIESNDERRCIRALERMIGLQKFGRPCRAHGRIDFGGGLHRLLFLWTASAATFNSVHLLTHSMPTMLQQQSNHVFSELKCQLKRSHAAPVNGRQIWTQNLVKFAKF